MKKQQFLLATILIIGIVAFLITKDVNIIHGCGIFGIINTTPQKFKKKDFCILGIQNDNRGGDSCGVFIDRKVEYGVDKKKLFKDFFLESKLIEETKKCTIALGHCRKTSVGKTSLETAQPVCIYNEKNEIDFVLMHNGTIYNYEELAKKYIPDINIKEMSDSQVMARIFYYKGYDVLSEYNGGAVFITVDYREDTPKIRAFKGASKKISSSTTIEEERPFYYYETNGGIVFSSIPTLFKVLNFKQPYYTLTENVLCYFDNGTFYVEKEVDRSKCCQSKTSYGTVVYEGTYYRGVWDEDYSDYSDYYNYYNHNNRNTFSHNAAKYITYKADLGRYVETANDCPYCHGEYCLNYIGNISAGNQWTDKFYFWNGYLLYNKNCWDFLVNFQKEFKADSTTVTHCCAELIAALSPFPIKVGDKFVTFDDNNTTKASLKVYQGNLDPFFCSSSYYVSNGHICSTTFGKYQFLSEIIKTLNKEIDFAFLTSIF